MSETVELLKLLADPTRLRIVHLLHGEELNVAELQEVLDMGQSRISSHLALLRQAGTVVDRREGKRSFYSLARQSTAHAAKLLEVTLEATRPEPQIAEDNRHLQRILERRREEAERYFNEVAGRLGKNYCPGRSWEAIGHFLLFLTPEIDIADLGAGEGVLSQLLARRARKVWCIDKSPRMVEVGRELAEAHGIENLHYKVGDIEKVPLADASTDLALLSQALHHAEHPLTAAKEAFRILRPGGQVAIIDLLEHQFERAREIYADRWLGFTHNQIYTFLSEAGFSQISVETVSREEQEPFFETILARGVKPAE